MVQVLGVVGDLEIGKDVEGGEGLGIGWGLRMESLLIFTLSSLGIQFESVVEVKTDMYGQAKHGLLSSSVKTIRYLFLESQFFGLF